MFLKFKPLLYSLIFIAGLEIITLTHTYVLVIVFLMFFISLYQGKKIGRKWKFSVLPVIFTLSSVALLYLITLSYEQQTFIILAAIMYYLSLLGAYRLGKYEDDQTARGMIMAATVSTIFFAYSGAYGLYLNFLVPLYMLMLIYMAITLLVSYQYFSVIEKKDKRKVWIYSFLVALVLSEIIWTMNFWPFGYLTTGVTALILYYVLWDLIQSLFLNLLSRKRVVANVVFFSVIVFLVLLSSKWIPVI